MFYYPNIEAERARRKINLEDFAHMLHVTRKTIYNWKVSGNIPQSKLEIMADIFKCSTDYLLEMEEEK